MVLAGSGSYARGEQPRSVPNTLAEPYARMVTQQRSYTARQAGELGQRQGGANNVALRARSASTTVLPLAERMYRPPAEDVAEFRRQQAAFQEIKRGISRDNAWMAVPALAPVAVIAGLGAAGAVATRLAPAAVKRVPFQFVKQDPYLHVGDNWATRIGRRAHADLRKRVEEKLNWVSDFGMALEDGRVVKPDVRTPLRMRPTGDKPVPYQMELKPNTESGRKAAARAIKMYSSTGTKTRAIFYDPKHYR